MQKRLPHLIGLSATAPVLATPEEIAIITTSTSGVYLDELPKLEWLKDLDVAKDFSSQGLYTMLAAAKTESLKETTAILLATIRSQNRLAYTPFAGLIGARGVKGNLPYAPGTENRLELTTRAIESGVMVITKIGVLTQDALQIDVTIPDATGTVLAVGAAPTAQLTALPEPLELPLDGSTHTFSFTAPEGTTIQNNSLSCGCTQLDKQIPFYLTAAGGENKGFIFEAELRCKEDEIIYLNYNSSTTIAGTIARMVRYKAASILVDKLLSSGIISRHTMLNKEERYGDRNHFNAKFNELLFWLVSAEGLNMALDNCYVCKTAGTGFRSVSIPA